MWRSGQRAGLITLRSGVRITSPVFYTSVGLQNLLVNASDAKQATPHRRGAAAARRAHNPEVTGSTPVAGILHFTSFTEEGRQSLVTLN